MEEKGRGSTGKTGGGKEEREEEEEVHDGGEKEMEVKKGQEEEVERKQKLVAQEKWRWRGSRGKN